LGRSLAVLSVVTGRYMNLLSMQSSSARLLTAKLGGEVIPEARQVHTQTFGRGGTAALDRRAFLAVTALNRVTSLRYSGHVDPAAGRAMNDHRATVSTANPAKPSVKMEMRPRVVNSSGDPERRCPRLLIPAKA
jgi:hypothetical protein